MLPSTLDLRGGRFNQSKKPLTERDWTEKRAKTVPGPGHYDTSLPWSPPGGRFNCAKDPSHDGGYAIGASSSGNSVSSNNSTATTSISSIGNKRNSGKKNHKELDGPKGPHSILVLPSTLESFGGRFNQSAKPLTERDWMEKRAKTVPGPGHYKQKDKKIILSGGKFNNSQSKNDVEWKIVSLKLFDIVVSP
jgi:hypothetical protein